MNSNLIHQNCLRILESSEAGYLTTFGEDGYPHTRAMLNLLNPEIYPSLVPFFQGRSNSFVVYFTTNTSSQKMAQLQRTPAASVYFCAPNTFEGFMIAGRLAVVDDEAVKRSLWQGNWTMYYPGGVEDPDYSVLRLDPEFLEGWLATERFRMTV